jgi:O-antigen/teichoic acid export membrane protein
MGTMEPTEPTKAAATPAQDSTFGRDVVTLAAIRLAAVGAGFLMGVIAARVLGSSAFGAAGIAITIGTIAALMANAGLNIAVIYFLGRRPEERAEIVHRSLTLGLVASIVAAILVVVAADLAARMTIARLPSDLIGVTAVVAFSIVAFELSGSVLLGLGLNGRYLVTQAIEAIGSLVLTALLVGLLIQTAVGFVIAAGGGFLAAGLYAAFISHSTVGGRPLAFDRRFAVEALSIGLRGQLGNVLQFLNLRLDLLVIPLFLNLSATGVYIVAVRMSEVVTQFANAAASFLFPAVSRSDVSYTELTERTVRATLLVVAASGLAIALLAEMLLGVFFGDEYRAGTNVLRITMIAMIPLAISRLLGGDLKGRGRPGLVSVSAGCALVVTVLADIALIPSYGIEGAALASLLAYSSGALVMLTAFAVTTGSSPGHLVPRLADVRQLITAVQAAVQLVGRRSRGVS